KPLKDDKDTLITPAIEKSIKSTPKELIAAIEGKGIAGPQRTKIDVESAFVRLLDDYKGGRLEQTFDHLEVNNNDRPRFASALAAAASKITLPSAVIRRAPNVSAHKQQKLYERLRTTIATMPRNIGESMHRTVPTRVYLNSAMNLFWG